jgi:hypothetical protein
VRQQESAHRKTQTPIVATQKQIDRINLQTNLRNLRFCQIQKAGLKMGIEPPIKIERLSLQNNICFCVAYLL